MCDIQTLLSNLFYYVVSVTFSGNINHKLMSYVFMLFYRVLTRKTEFERRKEKWCGTDKSFCFFIVQTFFFLWRVLCNMRISYASVSLSLIFISNYRRAFIAIIVVDSILRRLFEDLVLTFRQLINYKSSFDSPIQK